MSRVAQMIFQHTNTARYRYEPLFSMEVGGIMRRHPTLMRLMNVGLFILLLLLAIVLTLAAWNGGCTSAFGPAICSL